MLDVGGTRQLLYTGSPYGDMTFIKANDALSLERRVYLGDKRDESIFHDDIAPRDAITRKSYGTVQRMNTYKYALSYTRINLDRLSRRKVLPLIILNSVATV